MTPLPPVSRAKRFIFRRRDSPWRTVILLSLPRVINPRENFLHLFAHIHVATAARGTSYRFDVYFPSNATPESSNFRVKNYSAENESRSLFSCYFCTVFAFAEASEDDKRKVSERASFGLFAFSSGFYPETLGRARRLRSASWKLRIVAERRRSFPFLNRFCARDDWIGRDSIGNNFAWLMNANRPTAQASCKSLDPSVPGLLQFSISRT